MNDTPPRADIVPPETGLQALIVMIVTVASGALAYAWGGLVWALLSMLLAAAGVTVVQTLRRARHVTRRLEGRQWVDVSGLSSEQAAKVLSAMSAAGNAQPMPTSEVLTELGRVRERCKGDDVALAIELETLRTRWPRSAAVLGELARAHAAAGRPILAATVCVEAVRAGLRSGSFGWVLALLGRDELWSLELALTEEEWRKLRDLAVARRDHALAMRIAARDRSPQTLTDRQSEGE